MRYLNYTPGKVGALNFAGDVKIPNPTMQPTLDMRIMQNTHSQPGSRND